MRFNLKSFMAGIIVGTVGVSTVFAAPMTKALLAVYSVSAVTIDGKPVSFSEENRPFTVDGRTFLPVRAVVEALDKGVHFDTETATVIITSKDTVSSDEQAAYLSKDMVTGYEKGISVFGVENWKAEQKDNAGRTHKSGIKFRTQLYDADKNSDIYPATTSIYIGLLGEYTKFKGQFVMMDEKLYNDYTVTILADGKEIQSHEVKTGTVPIDLGLNVTGVKQLAFTIKSTTSNILMEYVDFGIVDAVLYQ